MVTTLYTTLLAPLSYSPASISHPIPLSAANCFSRLKLSVYNTSYLSPTVSCMYVDSLNLRQTVPNCPQLTPAIALSVVPSMFGYKCEYINLPKTNCIHDRLFVHNIQIGTEDRLITDL
jgi:hypothetical protein